MSSVPPIQDMPPQGGYSKINFNRVPAKKLFTGVGLIAGFLAIHGAAVYVKTHVTMPIQKYNDIEMRSARLALLPFLVAERDRDSLRQLRRNRDVEADMMKDVEGWEVGTWMGEPIYKTVPEGNWVIPQSYEHWAHANRDDYDQNMGAYFRR